MSTHPRSRFLTLVFPSVARDGLADRVRFCIHADWVVDRTGPNPYANACVFLAPHLPFSIIPRRLLGQLPIRLTEPNGETELCQFARQMGLEGAQQSIATLRFRRRLSNPRRSHRMRTFHFHVLVPPVMKQEPWRDAQLGSDFLLGYEMRLFFDFGRFQLGQDPDTLGRVRFDPLVPCGYLEYPGDPFPPTSGSVIAHE